MTERSNTKVLSLEKIEEIEDRVNKGLANYIPRSLIATAKKLYDPSITDLAGRNAELQDKLQDLEAWIDGAIDTYKNDDDGLVPIAELEEALKILHRPNNHASKRTKGRHYTHHTEE